LQSEEAAVSFSFEYGGENYKIKRSNKRGKPGRLVFKTPEVDLTERTMRDTQKKIESVLSINYDTFVNAVFFLQGENDQFVSAPSGKRKEVLSDILGLDSWEKYRLAAAAKIKEVSREMEQAQGAIAMIEESLQSTAEMEDELEKSQKALAREEKELESLRSEKSQKESDFQKFQIWLDELNGLKSKLEIVQGKRQPIIERIESARNKIKEYDDVVSRKEIIQADYARYKELAQKIKETTLISDQHRNLMRDLSRLQEKQKEVDQELARIPGLEAKIIEIQTALKPIAEHERNLAAANELGVDIKSQIHGHKMRVAEIEEQLAGLEGRHICPLCEQTLADPDGLMDRLRKEHSGIVQELAELEVKAAANTQAITELESIIAGLQTEKDLLRDTQKQIADIREAANAFDPTPIWDLETKIKGLAYDPDMLPAMKTELDGLHDAPRSMGVLETAQGALEGVRAQIESFQEDLKALEREENELMDQIAGAESRNDGAAVGNARLEIETLKEAIQIKEVRIRQLVAAVTSLEHNIKFQEEQKQKLLDLKEQNKSKVETHQGYSILQEAFSKKGIPALLIEQALPMIEKEANHLLGKLSDGRMSVHFVTQKAYSDTAREDMKETLDIEIQDQVGIREYEMYSGGESFRINFAVRMALSRILANRAGAKLRTLIIDEGFGSQDAAGRDKLIHAINTIQKDYDKVVVITHISEMIESFPVQLRVEKGPNGSRVRMI